MKILNSGCGDGKVRGVNLGGWFVLEPWITPVFFEEVNNGGDTVSLLINNIFYDAFSRKGFRNSI